MQIEALNFPPKEVILSLEEYGGVLTGNEVQAGTGK
jgi:hypothetical protein